MTNLHLAILSTVLTLVILGALWIFHKFVIVCFRLTLEKMEATERSLRSHIVDEIDHAEQSFHARFDGVKHRIDSSEQSVTNFIKDHFSDLRKHAEDLRNHAKELTDRAEVTSAAPRQAVTR